MIAFDLLFTLQAPIDQDDERRQLDVVNKAQAQLLTYRCRWNNNPKRDDDQKTMILLTLSIHLNPSFPGGLVLPHIHGLLIAKPNLRLCDIRQPLRNWWEHCSYSQLKRCGLAKINHLGRIGYDPGKASGGSREKRISFERLQHKIAYNFRISKPTDQPADIAHRIDLLGRVGIKTLSTRSREPGYKSTRPSVPHEFHPFKLGHDQMVVIMFDGTINRSFSVNDYESIKQELLLQAKCRLAT